jgi:hypothetical protein
MKPRALVRAAKAQTVDPVEALPAALPPETDR